MTHRAPRWKDHETWMCINHIPPVSLPVTATRCWFGACKSTRPEMENRPAPEERIIVRPRAATLLDEGVQLCAWDECDRPARPGSKYCSRKCSNKNARKRFRARAADGDEANEAAA